MLVPCKFLLCVIQLILSVIIIKTRADYIYPGIPAGASSSSTDYTNAEKGYGPLNQRLSRILACTILFIIMTAIEIGSTMMGLSVFFNQVNLFQIVLHVLGCLTTIWFILVEWSYMQLWNIWGPFGYRVPENESRLVPFLIEVGVIIQVVVQSNAYKVAE